MLKLLRNRQGQGLVGPRLRLHSRTDVVSATVRVEFCYPSNVTLSRKGFPK